MTATLTTIATAAGFTVYDTEADMLTFRKASDVAIAEVCVWDHGIDAAPDSTTWTVMLRDTDGCEAYYHDTDGTLVEMLAVADLALAVKAVEG